MKKLVFVIGSVLLSLAITFITFEMLSWYHFGDIPTNVVFVRLVTFFSIVEGLCLAIYALVKRR